MMASLETGVLSGMPFLDILRARHLARLHQKATGEYHSMISPVDPIDADFFLS